MSYTVESLLKQFPDAQLVADIVLIYRDKHIELGKRQDGVFNLTPEGKLYLESIKEEPKAEAPKRGRKATETVEAEAAE